MTELDELLNRGRAGDRLALSALVKRYQEPVAAFVAAQLRAGAGDHAHLEDVCQATFVQAVLGLGRLRDAGAFEGWLFQIARNACRDHLRSLAWRRKLFEPFMDKHAEVPSVVPPNVERASQRLSAAMERLDAKDRELMALTLDQKPTYAELARTLGLSVAATKSRLFRTRQRLGQLMLEGERDER